MPKKGLTEIVAVLDESGSMKRIQGDMEGGFATFVDEQRNVEGVGEAVMTLATFGGDRYEVRLEAVPIGSVPPLRMNPMGSTPLYDAIGRTIEALECRLDLVREEEKPETIIFLIVTDGEENASQKFKNAQIRALIGAKTAAGWTFSYLGANVDVEREAVAGLGLAAPSSAGYQGSGAGGQAMYAAASASVLRGRSAGLAGQSVGGAMAFTEEERARMANPEPTPEPRPQSPR
jgi:uncharacterized protein YegL